MSEQPGANDTTALGKGHQPSGSVDKKAGLEMSKLKNQSMRLAESKVSRQASTATKAVSIVSHKEMKAWSSQLELSQPDAWQPPMTAAEESAAQCFAFAPPLVTCVSMHLRG